MFYDVTLEVGEGLVGNQKVNFNQVQINKDLSCLEKQFEPYDDIGVLNTEV